MKPFRTGAILVLWLCALSAVAQPVNDGCATASLIPNPANYCSPLFEGDNEFAGPSGVPAPPCWSNAGHDVWYQFTALAPEATVTINGNSAQAPGGTLRGPAVALYEGPDCTQLALLGCATDTANRQLVHLTVGNLVAGNTYFIRADAEMPGAFQYCIQNYTPGQGVFADCRDATLLCAKTDFHAPGPMGPGFENNELAGAPCQLFPFLTEKHTTWYTWVAADNGTVEFTLTPDNPGDDLDFVLYRLPNGLHHCADKIAERCMRAGELNPASPCMGPTGLNATATLTSLPSGCSGLPNFLKYLTQIPGQAYALVVDNVTQPNGGFSVTWGGSGHFSGVAPVVLMAQPDSTLCIGKVLTLSDTITQSNGLNWHWDFGSGAYPAVTSEDKGPHTVLYTAPGVKTVTVSVRSALGCSQTATRQVMVDSCCALDAAINLLPGCLPDTGCYTAVATAYNALYPLQYQWNTGSSDTSLLLMETGIYTLSVTDATGCTDTVQVDLQLKQPSFRVPNAFTPNGDGQNDTFFPLVTKVTVLEFKVWSRWGMLQHDDATGPWDGSNAPSDVYVYRVRVRRPDGREEVLNGEVTLLR